MKNVILANAGIQAARHFQSPLRRRRLDLCIREDDNAPHREATGTA